MRNKQVAFAIIIVLFALGSALTGCSGQATAEHELAMAPMEHMPAEVQNASAATQEAYQFAFANPDVMQHVPCYCGCGKLGHKSSYACYVAGADADGTLIYDPHALGCTICVDITQDTMRMTQQGKSPAAIKEYIDTAYAKYGASNMP